MNAKTSSAAGVVVYYNVECQTCYEACDGSDTRKEAAQVAEKRGWHHKRGQWYCPECFEKRKRRTLF